ncbi:MAG: hypothetical protein ABI693_14055 [Bryobacteraceae bacterium]
MSEPYSGSSDVQTDAIIVASLPAWGVPVLVTSQATWLTFKADCTTPGAGSAATGGVTPITLNFCVDPAQAGTNGYYIGLIEVSSPGYTTLQVPVSLSKFPPGDLSAVNDVVTFNAGHLTENITVTADPTGQNNTNGGFSANLGFATSLGKANPPEGSWLSFVQTDAATPGSVTLTANPAGIAAGTYVNTVVLKDTKYNDVKTVKVTLTVQAQDAQVVSALPHIAVGDVWVTGFYVINNGGTAATATIQFYDDNGQPLSIPITGVGTVNTLTGNLSANGSSYYEAGTPQFALRGGWALVTASPSVTVQALFRADNGGGRYAEAAVPSSPGGHGFLIPFDATTFAPTGDPLYTGVGVANLDSATQANITCTARDSQGTVIPNGFPIPALSPLGHYAAFLFPILEGKRGTVQCTSNTNISAVALRAIGSGNAFSSLPVITLK